jgi:hypothetical protein
MSLSQDETATRFTDTDQNLVFWVPWHHHRFHSRALYSTWNRSETFPLDSWITQLPIKEHINHGSISKKAKTSVDRH